MFAIAFDLVVRETESRHPGGTSAAYAEIGRTLAEFGFRRIQGSVYVSDTENLVTLVAAMATLKRLPWFAACVRDIRAFRVEMWSDFTDYVKSQ